MKHKQYLPIRWISPLMVTLLLLIIVAPVSASRQEVRRLRIATTTQLNATIYLPTSSLQPLFQSHLDKQVPDSMNNAITDMLNKLPTGSQGWARQIATTLIQPTATLTQLTPQKDGLATTLRLSLYPGDPKPTNAQMLVKFSVLNPSTIQVSAQALAGSPALITGPLTTLQVPLGKLNSVATTPACGDNALAVGLQVPVSLSQAQPTAAPQSMYGTDSSYAMLTDIQQNRSQHTLQDPSNAYVVVPEASLAALGSSIDSLSIASNLTAQNLQLSIQNNQLVVTSDIMLGDTPIKLATATTYIQPAAANGRLVMHVQKTNLTVFFFFTFANDSYNQQIEQLLNSKLGNLLQGQFNVTAAAIGANTHIPCAAKNSLILTGTANLG